VDAEREDVRVFEQQQPVVTAVFEQAVLERVSVAVGDAAEPTNVQTQSSASQSRVSMIVLT
jgi:hypothetical protein